MIKGLNLADPSWRPSRFPISENDSVLTKSMFLFGAGDGEESAGRDAAVRYQPLSRPQLAGEAACLIAQAVGPDVHGHGALQSRTPSRAMASATGGVSSASSRLQPKL